MAISKNAAILSTYTTAISSDYASGIDAGLASLIENWHARPGDDAHAVVEEMRTWLKLLQTDIAAGLTNA